MRSFIVLGLLASTACVGDSPVLPSPDAGPGMDAAQQNDTSIGSDTSLVDSPPPCDASVCGSSCVDLATSSGNCGVCGHSCGNGTCLKGQCQPETLQMGLSANPVHLSVDSTGLYYSSDYKVFKCGLDTCMPSPSQMWNNGVNQYVDAVGASGGNLYFYGENNTGKAAVYQCPNTGCVTPAQLAGISMTGYDGPFMAGKDVYFDAPQSNTSIKHAACSSGCGATEILISGTTFAGSIILAGDSTSIFFVTENTGNIYKCPASGAGTCSLSSVFVNIGALHPAGVLGPPSGLAVVGSTLYILVAGVSGYTNGAIFTCPTSVSSCTPSLFVNKLGYGQAFAADANGLYWWAQDAAELDTCAISNCTGGQHTVATGISSLLDLNVAASALYWIVPGGTPNTSTIMRVAY
jgi:hypothetical protein